MRKIKYFAVFLLLFSGLFTAAQQKADIQRWYIGAFGGANISDVSTNTLDLRINNETTLLAGFSIQYVVNENLSFKSGIEYDQREFGMVLNYQGLRLTDTSSYVCYSCYFNYSHQFTGHYLTLPFVLQYGKSGKHFGFYVKAGLYYSLLLAAYEDGWVEEYLDPVQAAPFIQYGIKPGLSVNVFKGKAEKLLNTFDLGLIIGLGGTYALNKKLALMVEGNLQVGFQPIFESPDAIELYHKAFQLRGGLVYRLNFGGS